MSRSPIVFNLGKRIHSIFLVTIFLSFGLPASPVLSSTQIESSLQKKIVDSPETTIQVIVQKNISNGSVERYVDRLGGEITKDLTIINAFAVTLPAYRIAQLARHPGVRWISPDAEVMESNCKNCIATHKLQTEYNQAVFADQLWNHPRYLQGQGVTVAVVDSGIQKHHPDIAGRVIVEKNARAIPLTSDDFGHGTFVAGIIAGNGTSSKGKYIGIAPKANLINVKVSGSQGAAFESDVVAGLQWIYENREAYKIKVVNISINSSVAQSYHTSPLAAACEILWFNGIVVVVSAGNYGENGIYPPGNDPFVITVGATDSKGTPTVADDEVASFSAFGQTVDGFTKPDLVAPGRNIVGPLASTSGELALLHAANIVNRSYFLMSGTSVAAPIVSGAVALLLQDEPNLTPDQVKYRLTATANKNWKGYSSLHAGAGNLDVRAAVDDNTTQNANTGINVSHLLTTGNEGVLEPGISWGSVSWNSVSWNSVSWNSVSWNSVSWNSVSWNSDYWDEREVVDFIKNSRALAVDIDKMDVDEPVIDQQNSDQQKEDTNSNHLFLPIISANTQ